MCTVRGSDGLYFHISPDGLPAYTKRWRYAGDFRDGVAVVQSDSGYSTHIGLDGELIHNVWYVDLDVFHKGFARARDGDGWMHVNLQGLPTYEKRFQSVEAFYNGQARVERFDGALEVVDESGSVKNELRPAIRSEFACLSGDMVGFWRTETIGAAVKLGVFEVLPASCEEVAGASGLHRERLLRLLRALGELKLVERDGDIWACTARGEFLRADHPMTLADAALEYADYFSGMWKRLSDAMQKENAQWSIPDVFGDVAKDQSRCFGHHRMLRSYARHDYEFVRSELHLLGNEHVIDVGGGLGVLAQLIVEQHPSTTVSILERPEVATLISEKGSEVQVIAGDMFKPWKVKADVVLLARVLHDWDDVAAKKILMQARASLSSGGRIFIVEMLLSEHSVAGSLCDLHLLMVTGGRERTADDFEKLLGSTGFELREIRNLPALPSVIEASAI